MKVPDCPSFSIDKGDGHQKLLPVSSKNQYITD
jgi:hypothetical protein